MKTNLIEKSGTFLVPQIELSLGETIRVAKLEEKVENLAKVFADMVLHEKIRKEFRDAEKTGTMTDELSQKYYSARCPKSDLVNAELAKEVCNFFLAIAKEINTAVETKPF